MSEHTLGRIIAIDTMVLVWGIRRQGKSENLKKADRLFEMFEESKPLIILPSVVVAEYVAPIVDARELARTIAELGNHFQVEPFDIRDAALAATLWNHGKTTREMGKASARTCLKADAMIVATARNRGAREFYTEDAKCFDMANKAGMMAKRLPTMDTYLIPKKRWQNDKED